MGFDLMGCSGADPGFGWWLAGRCPVLSGASRLGRQHRHHRARSRIQEGWIGPRHLRPALPGSLDHAHPGAGALSQPVRRRSDPGFGTHRQPDQVPPSKRCRWAGIPVPVGGQGSYRLAGSRAAELRLRQGAAGRGKPFVSGGSGGGQRSARSDRRAACEADPRPDAGRSGAGGIPGGLQGRSRNGRGAAQRPGRRHRGPIRQTAQGPFGDTRLRAVRFQSQ
jgi:hypothetical protein